MRAVAALALTVAVAACSGGLGSAKADFHKGRIAEAKSELVLLEPSSRTWGREHRAEYALYRGLVHHSLGDRDAARVWLEQARGLDDAAPRVLSDDDRVRLKLALESLPAVP